MQALHVAMPFLWLFDLRGTHLNFQVKAMTAMTTMKIAEGRSRFLRPTPKLSHYGLSLPESQTPHAALQCQNPLLTTLGAAAASASVHVSACGKVVTCITCRRFGLLWVPHETVLVLLCCCATRDGKWCLLTCAAVFDTAAHLVRLHMSVRVYVARL